MIKTGIIKVKTNMKKAIKSLVVSAILILAASVLSSSCSEKVEIPSSKTCSMTFKGEVVGFDQCNTKSTTEDGSAAWAEGDMIYIIFYDGDAIVPGNATYSVADGWVVTYDGALPTGTDLKCEVRYFVNADSSTQYSVMLNAETEVYETLSGSYDFDGTSLTVVGSMTPKTGRIRFEGTSGDEIYVSGLTTFTTYSPASNTFFTTKAMVKRTVEDSGYTPYVYASFSDDSRKLSVIGTETAYTRTCSEDVLKVGESGFMTIPTDDSCENWRYGVVVTVNGVEFKMMPVAGHAAGFFLMAETETTKELYSAVVDGKATTTDPQYPQASTTYNEFKSFITSLNKLTFLNFSLPTSYQWLYAAEGGLKSKGYTYCGSNNPDEVAWYSANSDGKAHPVKQLVPNELGIYDLSGNVWEYTSTNHNSNSYSYEMGGGCYSSGVSYIKNTSYDWSNYYYDSETKSDNYGFRLILTCE
jgi:formylglycine-generating enzyme required for sulfatase activity